MEGVHWWERFVVEDARLCALCGGLCCRAHSGLYLDPLQFRMAWDLDETWSLSEIEPKGITFKVCMGVPVPLPAFIERGCLFWSEDGCTLPRWQRPLGCLALVPNEESVLQGEPLCSPHPGLSFVESFSRWRLYYQEHGMWELLYQLLA